jgi:Glycosyl transferase family 2
MRLAAIMRARNEVDIIEAFVRHHSALFDKVYITDHNSSDGTATILDALEREGLPIVRGYDASPSHYQALETTKAIKAAMRDGKYDYVVPLDCDEFVVAESRDEFETQLVQCSGGAGLMHYLTYTPTYTDDAENPDVLRRIQHRIVLEPEEPIHGGKVILSSRVAEMPSFRIGEGNHYASVNNVVVNAPRVSATIAHYPIRSLPQFVSRTLIGHWAWISRNDYDTQWVTHIRRFYNAIRSGRTITATDLTNAAILYATMYDTAPRLARYISHPISPLYDRLMHTQRAQIDVMQRVIAAAETMAESLRHLTNNKNPD